MDSCCKFHSAVKFGYSEPVQNMFLFKSANVGRFEKRKRFRISDSAVGFVNSEPVRNLILWTEAQFDIPPRGWIWKYEAHRNLIQMEGLHLLFQITHSKYKIRCLLLITTCYNIIITNFRDSALQHKKRNSRVV